MFPLPLVIDHCKRRTLMKGEKKENTKAAAGRQGRSNLLYLQSPKISNSARMDSPQIEHLQMLEEARRNKMEARPINAIHSKFRRCKWRRWKWRSALHFCKCERVDGELRQLPPHDGHFRTRNHGAVPGPLYGAVWEASARRRPRSGPQVGKEVAGGPYFCLREIDLEEKLLWIQNSAPPIYMVT